MDGASNRTHSYKLRSAGPVPVGGGRFVTQTFGIDSQIVTTYTATTTINNSDDMMGIHGGTLSAANWQRLTYLSDTGRNLFSGSTVSKLTWIDRDELT